MACSEACEPSRPCYARGCPNAGPQPPDPTPDPRSSDTRRGPNIRIGVGRTSSQDLDVDIHVREVIRGRETVHLGVGNSARRDFTARVFGNKVDSTEDLQVGVRNVADRDGYLRVCGNEFRGSYRGLRIGAGNRTGGDSKIVIAGNRWRPGPSHESDNPVPDPHDDSLINARQRGYAGGGRGAGDGDGDGDGDGGEGEDRRDYRSAWFRGRRRW